MSPREGHKNSSLVFPLARAVLHVQQLAFPQRQRLDHATHVLLVNLRQHFLKRLQTLPRPIGVGLVQHRRRGHRELEVFPAHRLDQHTEVELASALHFEPVAAAALLLQHAQRHVGLRLRHQPVPDLSLIHI